MKKILILLLVSCLFMSAASAKNYAKIDTRAIKKQQKFSTTNKYVDSLNTINTINGYNYIKDIKDPKLLKAVDYEPLTKEQISEKIKSDEAIYQNKRGSLAKSKTDNYNKRAYARDFARIYRIVDKIARSNNIAYMNWKVILDTKDENFNAYSYNTNCIRLTVPLFDSFIDNDDALAFVIGHEMGHVMLGHMKRQSEMDKRRDEIRRAAKATGGIATTTAYLIKKQTDLKEARNMEFAADIEGAKLILKAGYNLDSAAEVIAFMDTLYNGISEFRSDHPLTKKRVLNLTQNRKYFVEDQWREYGLYNWYNSEPLTALYSSDRNSIVFSRDFELNQNEYYKPETLEQVYTRYAYKSYLYGEFKEAIDYLEKVIDCNPNNFAAYLYASYASEYLYKQTGNDKYLNDAKKYINYAKSISPNNKYVLEQAEKL